jgi:hypothetical protein
MRLPHSLPVIGGNELAPLSEFIVRFHPTLLLNMLWAHGYADAEAARHQKDSIEVMWYGYNYLGGVTAHKKIIPATMRAVREFLGYPA